MPLDVVYIVRPGDRNEELRFSLRSLANLPHGDVWMVGHKPDWVRNVRHISGNPSLNCKEKNVYSNVLAACEHDGVPDRFVLFNDDFYVTEPIDEVPATYRCTLREHCAHRPQATTSWQISLRRTLAVLEADGHEDPLSYDLHVPMPVVKDDMRRTLRKFKHVCPNNPPQWRTLYGVDNNVPAVKWGDPKYLEGEIRKPFHSTTDSTWRKFGLEKLFPDPSPYEGEPCKPVTALSGNVVSRRTAWVA